MPDLKHNDNNNNQQQRTAALATFGCALDLLPPADKLRAVTATMDTIWCTSRHLRLRLQTRWLLLHWCLRLLP